MLIFVIIKKIHTMKKLVLLSIVLVGAAIALMSFTFSKVNTSNPPQEQAQAMFPAEIQKIFETSCFDCHTDTGNAKAKLKLNFSKWGELSDAKKVGKIGNINDEVQSGKMPTARYISNYPDRALTKEQKELVNKWAAEESAKLMGQ